MKIVFLDVSTLGESINVDKIKRSGDVSLFASTSQNEIFQRVKEVDVIITNKVVIDKDVMDIAEKLKLICVAATGTNNVDIEYARAKNIAVKNAVGYSTKSVAQFTFSCLLSLLHQTRYYDDYVKSGAYCKSEIFTHIHHDFWEIDGKVFGIVGLGSIGRQVARIAESFGAEVIYYSTSGKNNDKYYRKVELSTLLSESDILSIHAPLNEDTKGLIGLREIEKMKKNAILINMGRGGIVDESDVATAVDQDLIGGAVLDVYVKEPMTTENPLLKVKKKHKLLLTPHIAWASYEARATLIDIICGHIEALRNQ